MKKSSLHAENFCPIPFPNISKAILLSVVLTSFVSPLYAQSNPTLPTASPSKSQIPALVNGEPINSRIFNDHSALLLRRSRDTPTLKYRNRVAGRELKPLIYNVILNQELKKLSLKVDLNEVQRQFDLLKKKHPTSAKFNEYLIQIAHTEDSKKLQIWNRLATYLLMEKKGLLEVTENQIKKNYEQLKSRYIRPEQVRAQQILIYLPLNPKPDQVKKAFDRAQMLHADLMKKPDDFNLFVQRYSEERLAGRKGDLGFFGRGEMVQSVEDTVFNLKDNQIAPPVRSKYGWHILKKTGSRPRQEATFEELYPQLKKNLKRGNFQRQRMKFLKELWIKSQVQSSFSVRP